MKKIFSLVLVFGALGLGSLAFYQNGKLHEQAEQISALQKAVEAREGFVAETKKVAAKLEAENKAFVDESAALRDKLAVQATVEPTPPTDVIVAASPTPASKNPFQGMMDKMMKDPKMRATIASQQMAFFKPMYADLVKQLHLSPADSEKFFQLLAKQTEKGMEAGLKMLSGDKKGADVVTDPLAATSEEMKALLGDTGYKQYEDYQKSIPDRMTLSQISTQMANSQIPLRPDQSVGLLQIMQQEKLNMTKFTNARSNLNNATSLPSESVMEDTMKAQEERNARILTRSQTLLTPEQWKALGAQQKQNLEMQKMGMEMAKGMFSK